MVSDRDQSAVDQANELETQFWRLSYIDIERGALRLAALTSEGAQEPDILRTVGELECQRPEVVQMPTAFLSKCVFRVTEHPMDTESSNSMPLLRLTIRCEQGEFTIICGSIGQSSLEREVKAKIVPIASPGSTKSGNPLETVIRKGSPISGGLLALGVSHSIAVVGAESGSHRAFEITGKGTLFLDVRVRLRSGRLRWGAHAERHQISATWIGCEIAPEDQVGRVLVIDDEAGQSLIWALAFDSRYTSSPGEDYLNFLRASHA
jgi:hypothetical protein